MSADRPKGWSKAVGVARIDADTFLARADEQEECDTVQEAEWIVRVHAKAARHVARCEHPHNDCYCDTHWHDGEARVRCEGCEAPA